MANNRMYLVHRPTGKGVYLGKRMGCGWYDAPEDLGANLSTLYDFVMGIGEQDDFILVMETAPDSQFITDKAVTGAHDRSMDLLDFKIDSTVPYAKEKGK